MSSQSAASKISAQEFSDQIVAPEYRQPLKTLAECLDIHGWQHVDFPDCCGKPLEIRSFLGPYFVQCNECGKFAVDVAGPIFSGKGSVQVIDSDKVDVNTDRLWIAGISPADCIATPDISTPNLSAAQVAS